MKKRVLTIVLVLVMALVAVQSAGASALWQDGDDGGGDDGTCPTNGRVHPQAARIASQYGVTEDEIQALFCAGYGVGDVKKGFEYAATYGVTPAEIFAMLDAGQNWGDIRAELGGGNNGSQGQEDLERCASHPQVEKIAEKHNLDPAVVADWFCAGFGIGDVKNALVAAAQAGIEPDDIFTMLDEGMTWGDIRMELGLAGDDQDQDGEDDGARYCEPDSPASPAAARLSLQYGISAADVQAWLCDGLGAGEIKQALEISEEAGVPVADLLAEYETVMDWGQIRQDYGLQPSGDGDDEEIDLTMYCADEALIPPQAERIAAGYDDVEPQEVEDWLCAGYEVGDIRKAYSAAANSDYTVDEIFAMLDEGMGWGEIKRSLP